MRGHWLMGAGMLAILSLMGMLAWAIADSRRAIEANEIRIDDMVHDEVVRQVAAKVAVEVKVNIERELAKQIAAQIDRRFKALEASQPKVGQP